MRQVIAKIVQKKHLGPDGYVFSYRAPEIALSAQPGQFVLVRCSEGFDPLLRRPFSFHRIDKQNGTIDILFRVVGKGTALLAEKNVGEPCDILGPLGKGFELNQKVQNPIILAGGLGIAPMLAVAESLVPAGIKPTVLLGAKTKDELWCGSEFEKLGCKPELATDDGSLGFKGTVINLFLNFGFRISDFGFVYSCGPEPMLHQLSAIAQENNMLCQISLETNMACGLGACQGCVVQVMGPEKYKLVCKDGPVFDSSEIKWD
ncbi:MAG: dihydroorotate dehydrogenase electron transfer subunit [bacterium]|nr:dihydroorotate dehydrogenase electron transfer subunit [bacterium]